MVDEYSGLSEEQKKTLRKRNKAMSISIEFVKPYFEKFSRFNRLYNGEIPEELDCTFSKVMLNLAFSIVQNELPRSTSMLFSQENFFRLVAKDPELEEAAEYAEKWLRFTVMDKNRIFPRIIPTIMSVGIYGVGYRSVSHVPVRKWIARSVNFRKATSKEVVSPEIVSQNINVYSVLPAPYGGFVNTTDPDNIEAVPWLHWIDYITKDKLKKMAEKSGAFPDQIEKMLAKPPISDGQNEVSVLYKQLTDLHHGSDWIGRVREEAYEDGIDVPYCCTWTFFRDKWVLVGENKYLLAELPPLLDWFPIAKYVDTINPDKWFGTGLIEICEDIILAYLLLFNFRMDYLAQILHPAKFVREDIIKANRANMTEFDPTPYALYEVPRRVTNIREAIWYDRFPDVSPEVFTEETSFKQLLQEITAQPNYMKGLGGAGTLANETATGIVSLIEEGTARSTMRSLLLEYTGLQEELMLVLKWGKKYIWEDQIIRIKTEGGFPWVLVPLDAIDDGYGIELLGTRGIVHKNEQVKRMLSILPLLINNPNIPNQQQLLRDIMSQSGVFYGIDKYFQTNENILTQQNIQNMQKPTLGGGTPTLQNELQPERVELPPRVRGIKESVPARFAI